MNNDELQETIITLFSLLVSIDPQWTLGLTCALFVGTCEEIATANGGNMNDELKVVAKGARSITIHPTAHAISDLDASTQSPQQPTEYDKIKAKFDKAYKNLPKAKTLDEQCKAILQLIEDAKEKDKVIK